MTELVSIIMPAYNASAYIKQAVESILNQTYSNIELLIADDGSTDNTWDIINSFSDERIKKHRFDSNIGNLSVCNFLFKRCSGEFIGIQDADDWCDRDKVAKQVRLLREQEHIGLVATAFAIGENDGTVGSRHAYQMQHRDILDFIMRNKFLPFHCASILVRSSIVSRVGTYREYFDRISAADFDWIYRIACVTQLGLLSDTCYYYRSNPQSFTNTFNKNLKRKFSEQIAFFLFQQRRESGSDSLEADNAGTVDQYFSQLAQPYQKNAGLIFGDHAWTLIKKQRYRSALRFAGLAIWKAPSRSKNYLNTLKILKFIFWKKVVQN